MALTEKQRTIATRLANELISKIGNGPQPEIAVYGLIAAAAAIAECRGQVPEFNTSVKTAYKYFSHFEKEKKQNDKTVH